MGNRYSYIRVFVIRLGCYESGTRKPARHECIVKSIRVKGNSCSLSVYSLFGTRCGPGCHSDPNKFQVPNSQFPIPHRAVPRYIPPCIFCGLGNRLGSRRNTREPALPSSPYKFPAPGHLVGPTHVGTYRGANSKNLRCISVAAHRAATPDKLPSLRLAGRGWGRVFLCPVTRHCSKDIAHRAVPRYSRCVANTQFLSLLSLQNPDLSGSKDGNRR